MGAIAVVRVSGPGVGEICRSVAPGELLEPRHPALREIVDPGDGRTLDRALVTYFAGPSSYTGEDMLEISGHGGRLTPHLILEAVLGAGARHAEPGEFTRRAYLNGKVDLVQAEAIADLIEAKSAVLHRTALDQLDRGLSRRLAELRGRLVGVEALLAHHVDFPEEDDAPVPLSRVLEESGALLGEMEHVLATAPEGELLREGALVVLAGRPNAGKSSLYNALIGRERAIVTPEPGTTRDALEAELQLGGFPFRLVDTAGLREEAGVVEQKGIEVARRYIDGADLVLFCVECSGTPHESERRFAEELGDRPWVLVETKSDLVPTEGEVPPPVGMAAASVRTSVETGAGLDELQSVLPQLVFEGLVRGGVDVPVLTRARQANAMRRACEEVRAFRDALETAVPAEMAATHLKSAEGALEEVLGVVTTDDVLDVVFRDFCIGK